MRILIAIMFLFSAFPAMADTHYLRTDGGTAAQCNGLANVAYSVGAAPACAWKHYMEVFPPDGPSLISGGDTLIINIGEYPAGAVVGAPWYPSTGCNTGSEGLCYPGAIPSGPNPSTPTKILGVGWDTGCYSSGAPTPTAQIYGVWGLGRVMDLTDSSNVEIQCLDITDHMTCSSSSLTENTAQKCANIDVDGDWAKDGIYSGTIGATPANTSTNVLLKNLKIHGLTATGIHTGAIEDWTFEKLQIIGNHGAGINMDLAGITDLSNFRDPSTTYSFTDVEIGWTGCVENHIDGTIDGCDDWYGDGFGMGIQGGNFIYDNINIHHSMSDGLDNLYHISIYGRLSFTGGTVEIVPTDGNVTTATSAGERLTGAVSGTTALIVSVELTSGTWAGGDAAGNIYIISKWGDFINGESITESGGGGAALAGTYTPMEAGTITVKNSHFEGNAGSTIKTRGNIIVYNNEVIGNCLYMDRVEGLTHNTGGNIIDTCRASATSISLGPKYGTWAIVANNSVISESTQAIATGSGDAWVSGAERITGEERLYVYNNIVYPLMQYDLTHVGRALLYTDHASISGFLTETNNLYYNMYDTVSRSASANVVIADPLFVDLDLDASHIPLNDSFDLHISTGSPAVGVGVNVNTSIAGLFSTPTLDKDGLTRPTAAAAGAYELTEAAPPVTGYYLLRLSDGLIKVGQ